MTTPKEPREIDPVSYARRFTKEALRTLRTIMKDPQEPAVARIAAAKEILSRGHGAAKATVSLAERQLTDEQLRKLAAAILERKSLRAKQQEQRILEAEFEEEAAPAALLPAEHSAGDKLPQ